jgi:orotate phosphoribosyltransferase
MNETREQLKRLIENRCLCTGREFILSTGETSNFYFDCKRITLEGEGLALMSDLMLAEIDRWDAQPEAMGGLTMGADFITAAVIMRAFQTGRTMVHGSIARKEAKKHGTQSKLENELPKGTRIVAVDDVVTSGGSTIKACEEFVREGYDVVGVLAVVDRERGGIEQLRKRYGRATALFRSSEFPALVEFQRAAAKAKA